MKNRKYRKPLSKSEKDDIKNLFYNTHENGVPTISKELGIPKSTVSTYITQLLNSKNKIQVIVSNN